MLAIVLTVSIYAQCTKSGVTNLTGTRTISSTNYTGDVIIKTGAVITMNGTFKFRRDAFIRVERGAKLTISGSTLIAQCTEINDHWWGIQVLGYNEIDDDPIGIKRRGELIVMNSTFSNMKYGLVNSDNPVTNLNNPNNCGRMQIRNSSFTNSLGFIKILKGCRDMYYIPSFLFGRWISQRQNEISSCIFKNDISKYSNNVNYHILLQEGIISTMSDCTFEVSGSSTQNKSSFKPFVWSIDHTTNLEGSKFNSTYQVLGIRIDAVKNANAGASVFSCNALDMLNWSQINGANYVQFINNNFRRKNGGEYILEYKSVTNYAVDKNSFIDYSVLPTSPTKANLGSGLIFSDAGKNDHVVYKNKFENIGQPINTWGVNYQNSLILKTGLTFRCNEFKSRVRNLPSNTPTPLLYQGLGISVEGLTNSTPFGVRGIQASLIGGPRGKLESAGNIFTNHIEIFPNFGGGFNSNRVLYYCSSNPSSTDHPRNTGANVTKLGLSSNIGCIEDYRWAKLAGNTKKLLSVDDRIAINQEYDFYRAEYMADKTNFQNLLPGSLSPEESDDRITLISLKNEERNRLNAYLVEDIIAQQDSLGEDAVSDSIVATYFNRYEDERGQFQLADFYLSKNKFDLAIATIQNIPSTFSMNPDDLVKIADLTRLYQVFKQAHLDGRDHYNLTESEWTILRDIASNPVTNSAKVRSCNLLNLILNESCSYPELQINEDYVEKSAGAKLIDEVQIYPNPVTEGFTIKLNNISADKIEMIDLQGRVIYTRVVLENERDITIKKSDSNLPNGIYIVRFSQTGNTKGHLKLEIR